MDSLSGCLLAAVAGNRHPLCGPVPPAIYPSSLDESAVSASDGPAKPAILFQLVLWLLGMVSSYTLGGFIQILLILALVVLFIRVLQGRRPVV